MKKKSFKKELIFKCISKIGRLLTKQKWKWNPLSFHLILDFVFFDLSKTP
jgi:hypothetical protein